jgi:hypothetical protein
MGMNWKGFGRKQSWPNFKALSRNSPGGTEENHEITQDSRSPGLRFEPGTWAMELRIAVMTNCWPTVRCLECGLCLLGRLLSE